MKTCLVVDDSGVTRKIARRILEEMDFLIVEAEDGEKALQVCQGQLPDAILLDWNMPVMDGLEFLRRLRQLPDGGWPKVVFCTTENDMEHIARALRVFSEFGEQSRRFTTEGRCKHSSAGPQNVRESLHETPSAKPRRTPGPS